MRMMLAAAAGVFNGGGGGGGGDMTTAGIVRAAAIKMGLRHNHWLRIVEVI